MSGAPERYAVIDVGTNSVKFHIGERRSDGTWRRVVDRADVTRLGEGVDQAGAISEAALARAADAIAAMAEEARANDVSAIAAVGTAVFRIATNGEEAVATIRERAGVSVEILSGDEETRLAYLAASTTLPNVTGTTVVFDTGGGSSQFTYGHEGQIDDQFSVNVGAVAVTEQFGLAGPVSADVVEQARESISAGLSDLDGRPKPEAVVGMGGAVTNMTAVSKSLTTYDPDQVQGATLSRDEIDRQIELYRTRSADERRSIAGLQPKRAEVILAGACNVRTILEKLGAESMSVSDRGLRHGVLIERFSSQPTEHGGSQMTAQKEPRAQRLSDEDLAKVMELIKGANSVELKVTIPATAHRATVQGLPLDPVESQPRQVYFFDTPELTLNKAGVVVRARRTQGGKGDTVVKLRPVEPSDLPADLRRESMFNVEVDVLPGGYVCSASFKGKTTGQEVWDGVAKKKRLSKIFSKGQRAFYKTHAPEGLDLDSLTPLGPTFLLEGSLCGADQQEEG